MNLVIVPVLIEFVVKLNWLIYYSDIGNEIQQVSIAVFDEYCDGSLYGEMYTFCDVLGDFVDTGGLVP